MSAKESKVTRLLIAVLLVVVGCSNDNDLSPLRHSVSTDPAWIRDYDDLGIKQQVAAQAEFKGGVDAQIALKRKLDCLRGVQVSKARAVEKEMTETGVAIGLAMDRVSTNPSWDASMNFC